jgi:CheY-like chemotaxis protein
LVSNACKYTRDGNVTVLLKREPALKAGYSESTCRIQFSVTDTGRGIAPEDLHRIFEPFLRGHGTEDQPGVGLGLAVARQWVRNMGGELTVQSELDAGSCFRFTLDLICSEDYLLLQKTVPLMSLEGCKTYMPTLAANHPRVLLVDDNETNRVFLSALCENLGYAVVHASSGDEALLLCQFAKQPFIAALIDQVMPQMDGWELLKRLRQMEGFGATASVLISASPPCRPIDFPASVNFDLMLTKPFEESILMCFLCHELADVPRNAQNCWHLQKGPIQPVRTILPEYELQTFAELLDMGRLMRLTEWARKLSAQNEYAQVSTQIIQLAESADLPGLRDLLTQLRHSSTQIHSDNQGK